MAFADAGTPLLLAAGFHLFIGNAIIGIAEGLILALLFRRKKGRSALIMIAANYFSAFVGGLCGVYVANEVADINIYNVRRWVWIMLGVSYLLTLALEWPFVAFCLRKCDHWFKKSLWGSLIVQSASYLVLVIGYWLVSVTSLWTSVAIVQPSEIAMPAGVTVYYIGENDRDVFALDLAHAETRKVDGLKSSAHDDSPWLYLVKSEANVGRWDLVVEPSDPPTEATPHPTPRF